MERLFKLGIIILGVIFLVLYFKSSQVGRYQIIANQTPLTIVDTAEGKFYMWHNNADHPWTVTDPISLAVKKP